MMTTPQNPSLASTSESSAAKPLRADARRNRARILEAAETVFAAMGMSASTYEIARQARVGIGTVFRHFPTKEVLMEAILVGRMQRLAEEANLLSTASDPGEAFFTFFTYVVDLSETKNAFADALAEAGVDVQNATLQVGQELLKLVDTLLTRAQQAFAVRGDIGVAEVIALVVGTSRAAEHARWDRNILARTLKIVFDGLRPAGSY
jgi:AcrR family transcriptional regulator